ncbi:unnamed protein product [Rhizopus stolonifer]
MGCCNSVPQRDNHPQVNQTIREPSIDDTNTKKAPESPSLNSTEEKKTQSYIPSGDYPILVRLSSNGQDITIHLSTQPPFLSVAALRQQLIPHIQGNNVQPSNIRLIYLGRVLSDQYQIAPAGLAIAKNKTTIIQIQKECVLQAMVSNQQ